MTVSQLINQLATKNGEAIVVMSCDSEGNGYSPLANVELGVYEADTKWSGTFCHDDDESVDGVECVALFPAN